jgi:protease I
VKRLFHFAIITSSRTSRQPFPKRNSNHVKPASYWQTNRHSRYLGCDQSELPQAWEAINKAGAEVALISPMEGRIQGMSHDEKADRFSDDQSVHSASAKILDRSLLQGDIANRNSIRTREDSAGSFRDFFKPSKPLAAICHRPWTSIEADVVRGRRGTSRPS